MHTTLHAKETEEQANQNKKNLQNLLIQITVKIGTTKMLVSDLLKLRLDQTITLNSFYGEPVIIKANNKPIAIGEIITVDDLYGIKIIKIL